MFFRYRFNTIYRDLPPMRNGTTLELEPDLIVPWLGVLERDVARSWASLVNAREIPLSYAGVEGWRASELDAWQWLANSECFVGFLVDQGVFAIIERGRPVVKRKRD